MKLQELVLIVEDDQAISKLLSVSLEQEGYRTMVIKDLHNAKRVLGTHSPDLILLDLGLPDGDGKSLISLVRSNKETPIIVVSARNSEKEIVAALDLGADDYVTKPFSTHELLARVRSAKRRFLGLQAQSNTINCGSLSLDLDQYALTRDEAPIKLTPTEFNLLKYMMLRRNQVLTHKQILIEVWGTSYQNEMQYLRTYINSLRKKIEEDTTRPMYIRTELSVGYRFCCNQECKEEDTE
jgi:two-component system KDP operon response regulator KdpE